MSTELTLEDTIRTALVENLLLLYPQGPPADLTLIRKWTREILQHETVVAMTTNSNSEGEVAEQVNFHRALAIAMEEWEDKAKPAAIMEDQDTEMSEKKQPQQQFKSVSLFAQMDAGLWGAPRILLEDLQAVPTPEARLDLLKKVAHVDDVLYDWNEVLPMLQEGLHLQDNTIVLEYYNLHRKWFGQGRASMEHLSIRWDLCQDILSAVVTLVTTQWAAECNQCITNEKFTGAQETLFNLWQLWYDMWFDSLQQPMGHDEDRGLMFSMGHQVLLLIRSLEIGEQPSSSDHPSSLVYPAHFLALVDPTASWFRAWTFRMIPAQLVELLSSTDILPDLFQRLASNKECGCVLKECQTRAQLLGAALVQHSVSMLESILLCTRLQWFPSSCVWQDDLTELRPQSLLSLASLKDKVDAASDQANMMTNGNDGRNALNVLSSHAVISSEQLGQLFDLFLQFGETSNKDETMVKICTRAVEALFLGARSHGSCSTEDFQLMLTKWKGASFAANKERISGFTIC